MERYSEYKDSGIQWLGEIPNHWKVRRLGSYFSERKEKVSDKDYAPLSVTKQGIFPQLENVAKTNDGDNRKLVKIGDFVINSRSDRKGSSGVSTLDGSVSLINIVLQPRESMFGSFCNYLLKSYGFIEENYRNGRGIVADLWTTRYDEMKMIKVAMPKYAEQEAIVRYLDAATSKIDKAIAMQQKMIDLLNERKQIIIQKAVTKGLDENVEMKDSGVEWTKSIPSNWVVEPFVRHFTFGKGLPITKANLVEDGIAVISYGQIHSKVNLGTTIADSLLRYVSPKYLGSHPQCLLKKDDFIFADTSEDIEGSGNFAFNDYNENVFAGYHTVIARPIDLIFPKYYAYLFKSKAWKSQIQSLVNGVKVYSIGKRILKTSSILIPTKSEQREIVDYLDRKTSAIENSIDKISRQITLLQERKQIIINEVVTGKVKVS